MPVRGVWERRKLPQLGPGRSPGRKRVLVHFGFEKKNKSGDDEFDIFFSHSLGGRPPTPSGYASARPITIPPGGGDNNTNIETLCKEINTQYQQKKYEAVDRWACHGWTT